jgi:hypothetical protein
MARESQRWEGRTAKKYYFTFFGGDQGGLAPLTTLREAGSLSNRGTRFESQSRVLFIIHRVDFSSDVHDGRRTSSKLTSYWCEESIC